MKVEVFIKRGLLLLVFLFLINVVGAAHTVDVQLINYTSFYETQNTNFSLNIITTGISDYLEQINISIPTTNLNIINYSFPDILKCSNYSDVFSNFIINCTNIRGDYNSFSLNLTANIINLDQNIFINVYTLDYKLFMLTNTVYLNIINDNSPPLLSNPIPANNTFTNNLTRYFSIDVQDPETGIEGGNLSYAKCGSLVYTDQPMSCSQTNCNYNLNNPFNDGDDICYYFIIYNKGGSSNQSDIYLLNIDRSGPGFELSDLSALNNTNDDDGILEFNFTISDDAGISNCFLYINNSLVNTTLNANITYNMTSSNNQHSFYIKCNDSLNNLNQTPTYTIYHDKTSPIITNNQISVTYNSVTITWDTNEIANSLVNWDDNVALIKSVSNENNVTSHSLTINGLNETSTYYYQIFSTDIWENPANLSIMNFTTPQAPCTSCGGGGGGGGGGSGIPACINDNNWNCTEWSGCASNGIKTRLCTPIDCIPGYKPYFNQSCIYSNPQISQSASELEGTQKVTGRVEEVNKTKATGATVGIQGITGIGYAIALMLLLLILLGLYIIYDKYKYPHMSKRLIEKDLFLAQMNNQKKEQLRIPKPEFKPQFKNIPIPKPIIPSRQEKTKDVKDFMNNLRTGNFNKKL